jgi:hypothetical protein
MAFGDVLNKHAVTDVQSGPVAASESLEIGLVYEDGANGWKVAPVDGSVEGRRLYWNPVLIDNSSGALGDKVGNYYGNGALVEGEADGAIAVGAYVKTSTNASHGGIFLSVTVAAIGDWLDVIGIYRGHRHETTETGTSTTAAADTETNCVVELVR